VIARVIFAEVAARHSDLTTGGESVPERYIEIVEIAWLQGAAQVCPKTCWLEFTMFNEVVRYT